MRDLTQMQKDYLKRLNKEKENVLNANKDIINRFKLKMQKFDVKLVDSDFEYIQTTGIIVNYKNIVGILNSDILRDKEGLNRISELDKYYTRKPFCDGLFFADDHILLAHQYFRRGFHKVNNYSPKFIHKYWGLNHSEIDSYVAIDYDRVRIDMNNYSYLEEDTWFGASFVKEIENIKPGIVKLRPPSELSDFYINFFFNNAYSLDIKWEVKDSVMSFQAKEFKTIDITVNYQNEELHPVRYIHAEYELDNKYFSHFDGAIHFYTTNEYVERIDSDFNHNRKVTDHIKSKSFKLFKINGAIDVDFWVDYCSYFFSKNPLMIEYFQGEYPEYLKNSLTAIRSKK